MRTMKNLSALLVVLTLVACSTNPTNQWGQARSTLTVAQDTFVIAHGSGLITDQQLSDTDPVSQTGRAALDKAKEFLPEGGLSFEQYMAIVDAMLARLEQMAIAGQLGGN